jgi:fatty-acyl-CoA synthase
MEPLWEITMGDLIDNIAGKYPDNEAVVYTDRPFRKTYREFAELCDKAARGFIAMGVKKGDKVAIWATNEPEWLILMWATAKIGAIMVTVNTNYKIFELEYLLRQSDSMTLAMIGKVKSNSYLDTINSLCPTLASSKPGELECEALPFLKNVIFIGDDDATPTGMFNWSDLYAMAETVSDHVRRDIQKSLDIHDVINMQYTSGTTGFPKGVMLTHHNIINNGKCIGDCMMFTSDERLCITVPFFHCFGMVLAIMACVTHGSVMVPIDLYSPVKVMDAIQREKCTACHGVPTMFITMLEHPDFLTYDFSSMRTGIMAGSPCPVPVMRQVVEKMNMRDITIVYGLTESSPGCTQTRTSDSLERRVSTVGTCLPFVECKITDPETGEDLPDDVPGEFCARGYNIMKGYYKMEEATSQIIDADGWLHSGDIAMRDADGYYKITGRLKDMIIRGGENIYPKEIEEFLYTHPHVKDVQVIGIPSKDYGEEVMAYVVLKDADNAPSEDELKDFVREKIARHKVPKYIRYIDQFPMTASGKIQKYKLKELAIDELNLGDAADIETA